MSGRSLRILLLEDSPADAELISDTLFDSHFTVITERVDSEESFTRALSEFAPHVVLADHSLAQFNAVAALRVLRAVRPTAPLIVVSGAVDERIAVQCLRAGAEDIVLKSNLTRLVTSIESALSLRAPLERLSRRQLEVLRLVAEGLTTRQIARRLKLSAKTVETHRGEIMKRLGIHDVVGLVRRAIRLGVVPLE
jgi:DNA-binding NarL/FixJ family response regulator